METPIKENRYVIRDSNEYGIYFGNDDLVLFNYNNYCYSKFGSEYSFYENNGITRNEFCGGIERYENINDFTPFEIEIFEIIE